MKKWMKTKLGAVMIAALCVLAMGAFATALTDNRDTPTRTAEFVDLTQASNVVYSGAMVALNTSGKAVPASDTTQLVVIGRAEVKSDNTAAAYSASKTLRVRRGVFRWANGASLAAANVGSLCYVQDDATVTSTTGSTSKVVAGQIVDVDSSGVWVDTRVLR